MISQAAWRKYIGKLAAIDKKAADQMRAWVDKNGLTDDDALIRYAYGLATKYGEASATLSCEMYDAMSGMMKAGVPDALPAETATYEEVAKGVMWGKYHSPSQIPSIVGRQVRLAGADTMMKNAGRDQAEWAWVPQGDTCAFCITLASNGWQKASSAVLRGGHADHIHQNCDCTFAISFKEKDKKQYDYIYDPQKYKDMYYGADGGSPSERINYLRRQNYQRNKDEINAQKREAYQARQISYETQSQKVISLAYDSVDGKIPFYGLPDSMKDLPKISGNPKIDELVDAVNPYEGEMMNCVSCSAALALRLQGINAISIQYSDDMLDVVTRPWTLWNIPEPKPVIFSELKSSIEKDMEEWGNGAICQIPLVLNLGHSSFGHMITAFRFRDRTYYYDPQLKVMDASGYFDHLVTVDSKTGTPFGYYYYRVDGVEWSEIGKEMVKIINDHV